MVHRYVVCNDAYLFFFDLMHVFDVGELSALSLKNIHKTNDDSSKEYVQIR